LKKKCCPRSKFLIKSNLNSLFTMSRLAVPKMVKHSRRISQEAVGGLDADLKARENAKRDGGLESDCCAFLTALTGMEVNDMMEDLKVSKKRSGKTQTDHLVEQQWQWSATVYHCCPNFMSCNPVSFSHALFFYLCLPSPRPRPSPTGRCHLVQSHQCHSTQSSTKNQQVENAVQTNGKHFQFYQSLSKNRGARICFVYYTRFIRW
jgi:hypothetical protein